MTSIKKTIFFSMILGAEALYAGGIRQVPFSCFGRDCDERGKEKVQITAQPSCLTQRGPHTFLIDDKKDACQPSDEWTQDYPYLQLFLGSRPAANGKAALFTLAEMREAYDGVSPIVQLGYDIKFSYKSCSFITYAPMQAGVFMSCGKNGPTFPKSHFQPTSTAGEINEADFMNVDLSACTEDLIVEFRGPGFCEINVRLFEITYRS